MLQANESRLTNLMRNNKVEPRQTCSFTGMGDTKGRWMIADSDYPTFLDILHDYLFIQKKRPQNLVEQRRSDKLAPLLIDLDFRYPEDGQLLRRFNEDHISAFIAGITDTLSEFYDLSIYEKLRFFVCLRDRPYESKKTGERVIKDGIHIVCPDIILPAEHQQVLRSSALSNKIIDESFIDTDYTNSAKDIYDESISSGKAGWFFYGESKPDIPPYLLDSIYEYNPEDDTLKTADTDEYSPRQLMEILSIRYNLDTDIIELKPEAKAEFDKLKKVFADKPQMRNEITAPPVPTKPKDSDAITVAHSIANDTVSGNMPSWCKYEGYDEGQIEIAKKLAKECLSVERMDGFHSWLSVGWCLHTIDQSQDMFQVWMDCSAKSPKFRQNDVGKLLFDWQSDWGNYNGLRDTRLTLKSIHYWAKADNPARYKEIVEDDIVNKIQFYYDAVHTHVGHIMYDIFWENYKSTADGKKVEWYEYKNHAWRKLQQGIEIRSHIHTKVADLVRAAQNRVRSNFSTIGDRDLKGSPEFKRFEELVRFEKQLYNATFKNSVMQECLGIFYEEAFTDKLNMNPFTLGCSNGIVILRENPSERYPNVLYRRGKSEDNISFQLGRINGQSDSIPYIPYNPEDPIHIEINDFFAKIFPAEDLRDWVWRLLASCLEGRNHEQCFYVWTGVGGNGKSKLVELMKKTLGEYAMNLAATALTRKRPDSSSANPDIMSIRNKRFIFLQEPDDQEPLNTSRMKQFSGEDDVEGRDLFEGQKSFKITGKLHMMCNRLPPIHQQDRGTWRRIRVVPFVSKFVDETDPDLNPAKNIYPKDPTLDARMDRWRTAFLSRLLHVYEHEYCKRGLAPEPAIVRQFSDDYKESSDSFAKFKKAVMRKNDNTVGSETSFQEINRAYNAWFDDMGKHTGARKLKPDDLVKRLEDEFGSPSLKGKQQIYRHVKVFMSPEAAIEFDEAG
jgi:P4 family phage/plasmid primase-like protien